jgi:hypothetical protein
MEVLLGVIFAVILVIFVIYSIIMLKQARRFRTLGKRTAYISIIYIILAIIIVGVAISSYLGVLFN